MRTPKIPQQLFPPALILVAVVAALIVARHMLVPDTFGKYGHYRASAVDDVISQEIVYAGYQACIDCHEDVQEVKLESNHRNVACEVCHGPAVKHIDAPDEFTPTAPRKRGYCPLCHGYNPSRPSGFPQIIAELHNPGRACMSCHDPHNPLLPHAPEDCSACHRQIASQKMVSHHTTLSCTTCHITPEEHLVQPTVARAQKPKTKEVCGKCHAEGADSPPEIPRVDLVTHSERYMCWDCHYPHFPEGK